MVPRLLSTVTSVQAGATHALYSEKASNKTHTIYLTPTLLKSWILCYMFNYFELLIFSSMHAQKILMFNLSMFKKFPCKQISP